MACQSLWILLFLIFTVLNSGAPGFLKLLWLAHQFVCVCVSVCLSVYLSEWHDLDHA